MLRYGAVLGVIAVVVFFAISSRNDESSPIKVATVANDLTVDTIDAEHDARVVPNLSLIAISSRDQNAVITNASSELSVVSVGDLIDSDTLQVHQVAADRIVLKEVTGPEIYIVYLKPENGVSPIQVISSAIKVDAPSPISSQ